MPLAQRPSTFYSSYIDGPVASKLVQSHAEVLLTSSRVENRLGQP